MGKIKISNKKAKSLLKLFYGGFPYRIIAKKLNISDVTISRFIKKKKLTSNDRQKLPRTLSPKFKVGSKYNNLTILGSFFDHTRGCWYIECICDCGNKCQEILRTIKNGGRKTCGNKTCKYHRALVKKNGRLGGKLGYTGFEDISGNFWAHIRLSAEKRNLDFSITIEQAWVKFIKQNKKCALSGVELTFDYLNRTASLDRIDSNFGYNINNIQWVHKTINRMKGSMQDKEFIKVCESIYIYNTNGKVINQR